MAQRPKDTEYLYQSARIRAMETKLLTAEALRRLCTLKSPAEVVDGLSSYGYDPSLPREEMLTARLREGFDALSDMGCAALIRPLRIPYDSAQLKTAIKCLPNRLSPRGLTVDGLATICYGEVCAAYESGDFSIFTPNLAQTAPDAIALFAEGGNPQTVDALLDRACFDDMRELAWESGVPLLQRMIAMRIDLCNLQMAVRLCRMKLSAVGAALYDTMQLSGGQLEPSFFYDSLQEGGEALLAEQLAYTPYAFLCDALLSSAPLWVIEREMDNARMRLAREAVYLPFGAELPVGYAVALEYESTDLRILLAMKEAGASADEVTERLRTLYV